MSRKRLKPKARSQEILEAAVHICEVHGFAGMTRERVAAAADSSPGTVSRYYTTMTQLRRAVGRRAIKEKNMKILSSMLGDSQMRQQITGDLRNEVAHYIAQG